MPIADRKLSVFLCHAKEDKSIVRDLYRQLTSEDWIDVWLDEIKLLPGQEWDVEIENAVEQADVVIICLSNKSMEKEGYVQKELRFVLNIADEKPEGTIFVIPLRLDNCTLPRRIRGWQYVDYFPIDYQISAYRRLLESLKLQAKKLKIGLEHKQTLEQERKEKEEQLIREKNGLRKENGKSPIVAIFLSFIFGGGGGQIYLGQWKKGVVLTLTASLTSIILIGFVIYIFGMVDAYSIALKMNDGRNVGEWEFGFNWKGLLIAIAIFIVFIVVPFTIYLVLAMLNELYGPI